MIARQCYTPFLYKISGVCSLLISCLKGSPRSTLCGFAIFSQGRRSHDSGVPIMDPLPHHPRPAPPSKHFLRERCKFAAPSSDDNPAKLAALHSRAVSTFDYPHSTPRCKLSFEIATSSCIKKERGKKGSECHSVWLLKTKRKKKLYVLYVKHL